MIGGGLMKKLMITVMILAGGTASIGWGQTTEKRHHTRPPYSGPSKNGGTKKPLPSAVMGHPRKASTPQVPKASHILVR